MILTKIPKFRDKAMKKLGKKKGMTLIEVVAAMSIFVIVATALVGTITTAFNMNSKNKNRAEANANSRTFIEILKSDRYRPDPYTVSSGISPGNYRFGFKDDTELESVVSNFNSYKSTSTSVDFDSVKSVATGDNKYVMAVKITWLATDKLYQIDVYSWELSRGKGSEIVRRALVAPK